MIQNKKEASEVITESAFFQARKQLCYTAFQALNRQVVNEAYQGNWKPNTWKEFRLCAIDGTSLRLPNEPNITEYFGFHKGRAGQGECSMGMASVFYDVLVIDSAIHPSVVAEKTCVEGHLQFSQKNDLVLFDRGYIAFWLYAYLLQHNIHFCMRAKTNQSLLVKDFVQSGKRESIVTFHPNIPSIVTCKEKGLYHLRWGIEENYKRLKQWVEIENFSGKSLLSVRPLRERKK